LLSHGRWFSPGTPAYSTTKTGRHDIAEILLKVALNTKISNQIKSTIQDGCYCQKMEISLIPYCCFIISQNELKFKLQCMTNWVVQHIFQVFLWNFSFSRIMLINMQFRRIKIYWRIFLYENTRLIWTNLGRIMVCIQWSCQPTNMATLQ
jgi:hypothetical protein